VSSVSARILARISSAIHVAETIPFIGNLRAALGQEILNVAVAQCESEMRPDCVLDNRRREAVPAIGELIHGGSLSLPGDPFELRFRDNALIKLDFIPGQRTRASVRPRSLPRGRHADGETGKSRSAWEAPASQAARALL
jgi:hypothetical protein